MTTKMIRSYQSGTPIPWSIPCPEEVLQVKREGRVAVVLPTRRSSVVKLQRMGFEEAKLDASAPGPITPGEVADPAAYEAAVASGALTPVEPTEAPQEAQKPKRKKAAPKE